MVLQSPDARDWLRSRLAVSRKVYRINKLKLGEARSPHIWMVTGVQLLSGVQVSTATDAGLDVGIKATVPMLEPVLGAVGALTGGVSSLSIQGSRMGASGATDDFTQGDERVWAARFQRLEVKFYVSSDDSQDTADLPMTRIPLRPPQELGRAGMRGLGDIGFEELAEFTGVAGGQPEDVTQLAEQLTRDDWGLFDACLQRDKELLGLTQPSEGQQRALLIGSPHGGLAGVEHDVAAMDELLSERGFKNTIICGQDATRDGILDAIARFIDEVDPGAAAVLYYSGHGHILKSPGPVAPGTPLHLQYIVPIDYTDVTADDFRGIADLELSHFLEKLTCRTRNVSFIFDCCHSGGITRGSWRAKGLREQYADLTKHIQALQDRGLALGSRFMGGNPNAVRIVAAGSHEMAFEGPNADEIVMGRLTDELVRAIRAAGTAKVSWNSILIRLQEKFLHGGLLAQHPQIEGPHHRLLFSLETVDTWGELGLREERGTYYLQGGRIAAVSEGDIYVVVAHSGTTEPDSWVAKATVEAVYADVSVVSLQYQDGHDSVPGEGVKAIPIRRALPLLAVKVIGDDQSLVTAIKRRIEDSKHLRNADESEIANCFTLRADRESVTITNVHGIKTFESAQRDGLLHRLTTRLENISRAECVLRLENVDQYDTLFGLWSCDMLVKNKQEFVPKTDWTVQVNEKVFIGLTNLGETPLYFSVLAVNFSGTIYLLTSKSPDGLALPPATPGQGYLLGFSDRRNPRQQGFEFEWPDDVPKDSGAIESSLLVIVTEKPLDVRGLVSHRPGHAQNRSASIGGRSKLSMLTQQLSSGGASRDMKEPGTDDFLYDVRRLRYKLLP